MTTKWKIILIALLILPSASVFASKVTIHVNLWPAGSFQVKTKSVEGSATVLVNTFKAKKIVGLSLEEINQSKYTLWVKFITWLKPLGVIPFL